jgi:hypothetical protein
MEASTRLPGEFSSGKRVGKNTYEFPVMVGGRTSCWGRELSRSQSANWIVVHCETADGTIHRKVVQVPDGRLQRTVRVEIP